jgi:hypothetical protein
LESIVAQGDQAIEVLAVDDGSTDATLDILRDFAPRLPMQLIERKHGGNWVANVNLGLARARGKYVNLLHQDDEWLPRRLAVMRRLIVLWPGAALLLHPCWYVDPKGRRLGYWHCPLPRRDGPLPAALVVPRLLVQCSIGTPAALMRAEAVRRVGPLDEDLWYSADWDYWLRLASLGQTVYCPSPLAGFRIHSGSQTLTRQDLPGEMERQQRVVLDRHLPRWEAAHPDGKLIARSARFSAEVNVALARFVARQSVDYRSLASQFLSLGPSGWQRYLRDSRIVERCLSRLNAGAVDLRHRSFRAQTANESVGAAPLGPPSDVAAFDRALLDQCLTLVSAPQDGCGPNSRARW